MSVAQYFDIHSGGEAELHPPSRTGHPGLQVVASGHQPSVRDRQVIVALDSVMYTGRVPMSTWTFVIQVGQKLWISDRTTMYFGKPVRVGRPVYHGGVQIKGHRIGLDVGISAYNSYGDLIKSVQPLNFYEPNDALTPSSLIQVEHNWMQLMFKFRLRLMVPIMAKGVDQYDQSSL